MLDHQRELCRHWAAEKREVTRIYFFGSRVGGCPRSDSDLDIFVVASPGAVICSSEEWTDELTSLLGVTAHINDHFTADPVLIKKIRENGLLIFSRYECNRDFEFEDESLEIDPNEN